MTLRRFVTVVIPVVAVITAMITSLAYQRGHRHVDWPEAHFERGLWLGPVLGDVRRDSVRITWQTIDTTRSGVLVLDGQGREVMRKPTPRGKRHEVHIEGLSAGNDYRYVILGAEEPLSGRLHPFRTAPADARAGARFLVFGDSGSGKPIQFKLADRMRQEEFDFVLHTGDATYNSATPMQVRHRFLGPYTDIMARVPFYVSMGNHDLETDEGRPTFDVLPMPTNEVDGSERYFAFEYGCVRVICLDSQQGIDAADTPQLQWLERTLAKPTEATWTIVITHEPTHTWGAYAPHAHMRRWVAPILERHGVDIVFAGDDHNYQRTLPMRGSEALPLEDTHHIVGPPAPIYIVTAGGGKNLYGVHEPNGLVAGVSAFHFVTVDARPDRLFLRALGAEGEVLDSFTLTPAAR